MLELWPEFQTGGERHLSYEPTFWFPVKRHGWGWGLPVRWQGWLVLVSYLALMGAATYYFRGQRDAVGLLASTLVLTVVLVFIVFAKGERPVGWRWDRK